MKHNKLTKKNIPENCSLILTKRTVFQDLFALSHVIDQDHFLDNSIVLQKFVRMYILI